MNETDSTTHQKLKDETLCKIGSNLLLSQQIEGLWNIYWEIHKQGIASDLMVCKEWRMEEMQKHMRGLLIKKYSDEILSELREILEDSKNLSDLQVSFSFRVIGDIEFCASLRKKLKIVVNEGNKLVHHFLQRWHPDSLDRMADASVYLDKQRI